jgi:hypothetical protein
MKIVKSSVPVAIAISSLLLTSCGSAPTVSKAQYAKMVATALEPATSRGGSLQEFTQNSKSKTAVYEGIALITDKIVCGIYINPDLEFIHTQMKDLEALPSSDSHYGKDPQNNYVGQICTGSVPDGSTTTFTELGQSMWGALTSVLKAKDI